MTNTEEQIFAPEERAELVATFGEPYVLRLEQRARDKHREDKYEDDDEDDILGLNTAIALASSLTTNDDPPSTISADDFSGFSDGESGGAGAGGEF